MTINNQIAKHQNGKRVTDTQKSHKINAQDIMNFKEIIAYLFYLSMAEDRNIQYSIQCT